MGKPSPPPPPPPPPLPLQPPAVLLSPLQQPPQHFNLDNNNISPSILLIIVIIAIIFFISGLLHLLVRLLLRPPTQRNRDHHLDHVTVLQGQLQQLFHLHDSGVDQAYIDTLPLFFYKAIIGVKDPFDCAVCLCEFEGDDKLRLLPHCSHAFHVDCIDTWLLSHSTCPLCRASLLGGGDRGGSTVVCVLESNSGDISAGEIDISNPSMDCDHQVESGSGHQVNFPSKSTDKQEEKIVNVKLGKFRNVDVVGEGTSEIDNIFNNNNIDNNINNNINNNSNSNISGGNDDLGSRRCYSMGSFAYVLDETSSLQVPIRNTPIIKKKKQSSSHNKKANLPLRPGHRAVMSEYGCDSQREFNVENRHSIDSENGHGLISKRIESFSISKIWGRGGGERSNCNKMKGMSNYSKENNELSNSKRSVYTNSFEINVSELGNNNDEEETQSCYSVDSLAFPTTSTTSSTTRRTLLWLMGRTNNKIVHNHSTSFSSNV